VFNFGKKMEYSKENYLPVMAGDAATFREGRNVRDGYARGWGLQFGNLREKVREDKLFQEANAIASGRTVVSEDNRMNIFLMLKFFLGNIPFGHIVEFGSYKGGNALFMAYVVDKLYPGMKVYALDTFAGMPITDAEIDAHRAGDFKDVDLEEMKRFAESKKITNLEFVQGLFQDTAPTLLPKIGTVALAHIDCDIYSAVVYSYEVVKPFMVSGGYYVFDDAIYSSCLGATEAVELKLIKEDGLHSEQIFPQYVFRSPYSEKS
jgi:Macrocin-O-methyltransferase (TylF)